jgi:phosphatidylserine decarboxylase
MDTIRSVLVTQHREGWRFVAIFLVGTLLLFWLWAPLGWLGVVLTLWCAYFFRDPPRTVPTRAGLVVSPGDGVVQLIERAPPPPELDMGSDPKLRISIFLNVFNVHINRLPLGGTVGKLVYRPGKFLSADLDKASEENERQSIRVDLDGGRQLAVVQIAGLVARRIVCDLREGQVVATGERFGLIRFGSRCDVYLDDDMVPLVDVGMTAIGGETVIADAQAQEAPRRGEVR